MFKLKHHLKATSRNIVYTLLHDGPRMVKFAVGRSSLLRVVRPRNITVHPASRASFF